jgi:hypothetical protein
MNKIIPTAGKRRIDPAVEEQADCVDHRMSFTSCVMLAGSCSRLYIFFTLGSNGNWEILKTQFTKYLVPFDLVAMAEHL